ncbi:hypothetical protein [Paenibacillus ottowii]|nr:hypothetical protein [Paenibacillus polymyxa]
MPTARAAATSVIYGNDIYVIGGYNETVTFSKVVSNSHCAHR